MPCLEDEVLQSKGDFEGGFCGMNRSWINRDSEFRQKNDVNEDVLSLDHFLWQEHQA